MHAAARSYISNVPSGPGLCSAYDNVGNLAIEVTEDLGSRAATEVYTVADRSSYIPLLSCSKLIHPKALTVHVHVSANI